MILTTNDYQKLQARARNVYVFISGCRSLSQSFGVSFFELGVAANPTFADEIVILPVMHGSRDIAISGFGSHVAISGCH